LPPRQAIDFLRRRYAAAILCDDAATACRLRAQLDAMMNRAGPAEAIGEAPPAAPIRPLEEAWLPMPVPPAA
jgi:hypothetical protein